MAIVVEFIKDYAAWIYGACALVALWYLRAAVLARQARRSAVFSLEREAALNRTYSTWSVAFALIVVMSIVYFLSTVVSPAVAPLIQDGEPAAAATRPAPSPTSPTPEVTPTVEAAAPTARPSPRPTLRLAPTAVPASPTPPPPAVQAPGCPYPSAAITSPGLGAEVSGMVPIMGSANRPDFKLYKLEYGAGANPTTWSYFADANHPVENGLLGTLNAGILARGVYSVRVIVIDKTGNYYDPPCQTSFTVK